MKTTKRIVAIICVIILAGMYIAAFVLAILDRSESMTLFKGSLALTIFVPVVAYGYMMLHRYAMRRSKRKDYSSPGSSSSDTSSSGDGSE